jgi:glycosyltransferase involved in cell wall biosynthesis
MSELIVWFSKPDMVDLMDEMPPAALLIYHVVDEYTTYAGQTQARLRQVEDREKEMMAQVDGVIVVSRKLYEAKQPLNPNTYLVPNGVNYRAYTAALADPYLPDSLQAVAPPRLGYIGLIGDKLDFTLLKELAEGNPEWSLVLLGEVSVSQQAESWRALRALPNVYHLGPVEASQVPQYVKGFQVGLMPYLTDRHAEYVSPLKLYDYLAAGLPVVSVDIPATHEFSKYIHLADSPQDFSQAVRAALADTAPERHCARRAIVAQHTWEARVEQLSDLIESHLVAKASPNHQAQSEDAWRSGSPAGRKSTR